MGALDTSSLPLALEADADLVVWREQQLDAIASTRPAAAGRLHVKYDSGMGRLGTSDADLAVELAERIAAHDRLELAGLMTHFATADEPDSDFFDVQLDRFKRVVERVKPATPSCVVHAANSAAALRSRGHPLRHGALRHRDLRAGSVPLRSRPTTICGRRSS